MTPMDFTMITRFQGTEEAVEFSSKLANDFLSVRFILGFPLVLEKCGGLPIPKLMEHSFGTSRNNHLFILEQRVQIVIFVILVSTIMANGRHLVKFHILASMRHINRVKD